jgi:molybdopterin-guanine dinucleotide biosynthesis protein A
LKTTDMSAVILAGGSSTRMVKNKLLLPLGKFTIVETLVSTLTGLFAECIIVTDRPQDYRGLPVRIAPDLYDGVPKSSLRGIHGGLSASRHAYSFIVGGDMPFVVPELVTHLCTLADGYDLVIPWKEPHFHPLAAVYSRSILPLIDDMLASGNYKLNSLRERIRSLCVQVDDLRVYDPQLWSLFNINTPDDYAIAMAYYESDRPGEENLPDRRTVADDFIRKSKKNTE